MFFRFFIRSGCYPAGIDGVAAGFDQELALEAKPTADASKTLVSTRTNGFYLFLLKVNR